MFYEKRDIDKIIKEETERLLESTYNINGFQDGQWGATTSTASVGQQTQQDQPSQVEPTQQQQQMGTDGKGVVGQAWNWAKQKGQQALGGIKTAGREKMNKTGDKRFAPADTTEHIAIISDLIKHNCMDETTARQLHMALFGSGDSASYIDEALAGSDGEKDSQQTGPAGGDPSFDKADEGAEFSDEMVQSMQKKLSSDGSNPYANIEVNLVE